MTHPSGCRITRRTEVVRTRRTTRTVGHDVGVGHHVGMRRYHHLTRSRVEGLSWHGTGTRVSRLKEATLVQIFGGVMKREIVQLVRIGSM